MTDIPVTTINVRTLHEANCTDCALNPVCLPPAVEDTDLDQLEEIIERRRPVARGVPIFRQGEAFSSVYAVRSGAVKTCLTLADGEEQITGFYLPGEIVGLDAIGQQRHGNTAVALESTSVCAIPFDQLEPLGELTVRWTAEQ